MLRQVLSYCLGTFIHRVLNLFLAQEHHIPEPGNLDHDNANHRQGDEDRNYGENSFQLRMTGRQDSQQGAVYKNTKPMPALLPGSGYIPLF